MFLNEIKKNKTSNKYCHQYSLDMSIKVLIFIIKINLPKNNIKYGNWIFSQNDYDIAKILLNWH